MTNDSNLFSSLLLYSIALTQLLSGGFVFYFFQLRQLSHKEHIFFKEWGISYIATSIGLTLTVFAKISMPSLIVFSTVLFLSGFAIKFSSLRKLGEKKSYFYEILIAIFLVSLMGVATGQIDGTIKQNFLSIFSLMIGLLGLGIGWASTKAFDFESNYKKILSINFCVFGLIQLIRALAIYISDTPISVRQDNLINIICVYNK